MAELALADKVKDCRTSRRSLSIQLERERDRERGREAERHLRV